MKKYYTDIDPKDYFDYDDDLILRWIDFYDDCMCDYSKTSVVDNIEIEYCTKEIISYENLPINIQDSNMFKLIMQHHTAARISLEYLKIKKGKNMKRKRLD